MTENIPNLDPVNQRLYDLLVAAPGRPEALDELLRVVWPFWFFVALRILGNRDDAADAAQEASIKLCRNLHRFDDGRPGSTRAWLAAIGARAALDIRRRKKPHATLNDEERAGGDDPALLAELRDEARHLLQAIHQLPADLAEVITLRFADDLKLEEIGERTGYSITGVHHKVKRGVRELTRRLAA